MQQYLAMGFVQTGLFICVKGMHNLFLDWFAVVGWVGGTACDAHIRAPPPPHTHTPLHVCEGKAPSLPFVSQLV